MKTREIESKNENKTKSNYIQQVENEVTWEESPGRAGPPNSHYALED